MYIRNEVINHKKQTSLFNSFLVSAPVYEMLLKTKPTAIQLELLELPRS